MALETNKRIATNTILLYIRMLILMAVALYTSRVVLQVIGIDDYGIYNVVAGIVVLFSFLNNAMTNASLRFFSFYIGNKDIYNLSKVFSVSIITYLALSLCILVLSETIGLWLFDTYLNIPESRFRAAKIVFQFSIITFILNVLRVPFNSMIVAHEKMAFYAYISILEAALKLFAVFCLQYSNADRLIIYAALMMIVPFICNVIYSLYCTINYSECKFSFVKDKSAYKELLSFTNWSMLGGVANVGAQQGGNILINIFYGVSANAGFGIANQVSHAVSTFVNNFQTAFNPQIIKLYARGEIIELNKLVSRTALFSFYLIWLISLPILINLPIVFKLWLGTVPPYATIFSFFMIAYYLVDAIQAPLFMSIYATGKIKIYQIWLSSLIFLNIPISLYALKFGAPVYVVLLVRLLINIISAIIRTMYIKQLYNFDIRMYLKKVMCNAFLIIIITTSIALFIKHIMGDSIGGFLTSTILTLIISAFVIYFIGLSFADRNSIRNIIKSILGR